MTNKMIQIRNVPSDKHQELVRRAKLKGISLSDYMHQLIDDDLEYMTMDDINEILRSLPPSKPGLSGAEAMAMVRKEEEEKWERLRRQRSDGDSNQQ